MYTLTGPSPETLIYLHMQFVLIKMVLSATVFVIHVILMQAGPSPETLVYQRNPHTLTKLLYLLRLPGSVM